MCLISVLPKGTVKYSEIVENFVRNGMRTQRHGSGIMWKKNGENVVNIKKGFFEIEELLSFLQELKLTKDDELVIHHRTSTQGLVSKQNTHPFVISPDHDTCVSLEGSFDIPIMVHNGMFSGLSKWDHEDFSDTYSFAHGFMARKSILNFFREDYETFALTFHNLIGYQRLCFLFPEKDLLMHGRFVEDDGYFHSNECYKDWNMNDYGGHSSWTRKKGKKKVGPMKNTLDSTRVGFARHANLERTENSDNTSEYEEQVNTWLKNVNSGSSRLNSLKIKLNDSIFELDAVNCTNFYYIIKDDTRIRYIDENQAYRVTNWDDKLGTCRLYVPNKSKEQISLTINELKKNFWYNPTSDFQTIYSDFLYLREKLPMTKKVMKSVSKQINHKSNSKPETRFIVGQLGQFFSKASVEMWLRVAKNDKKSNQFVIDDKGKLREKSLQAIDQELREISFGESRITD